MLFQMNSPYPVFLPQQFFIAAQPQYIMPANVSQVQTSSPNMTIQQEVCPNQVKYLDFLFYCTLPNTNE